MVHLTGLAVRPGETFSGVEEIALTLSEENFARLVGYLHESFERGGERRAKSVAPGLYGFSRFYPATGEFHLFNTWTARGLATAGVDISASGKQSAEDQMQECPLNFAAVAENLFLQYYWLSAMLPTTSVAKANNKGSRP